MLNWIKKIVSFVDALMKKPWQVFIFIFIFLFFSLLFDESLFKVSSLYHRLNSLTQEQESLQEEIKDIVAAQEKLKDSEYVEFLVKDKLNWSKKKELLFLFIESKTEKTEKKER